MITISLNQIKAYNPNKAAVEKLLASKGGDSADMELQFPVADIITSNGFDDALWALRCLPEHDNLWRKLAVSYAKDVQHLMTDPRSINALDVAWRHSDGLATDDELASVQAAAEAAASVTAAGAARDAAWAARAAAWAARAAVWDFTVDVERAARAAVWAVWAAARDVTWAAARQKQQARLVAILTAGRWVEAGNE